jgi:hypothetical protein
MGLERSPAGLDWFALGNRNEGVWVPVPGFPSTFDGLGLLKGTTVSDPDGNAGGGLDSSGAFGQFVGTAAVAGSVAGFHGPADILSHRSRSLVSLRFAPFAFGVANLRGWFGLTDAATLGAMFATDDPAQAYVGLQFSTNRGGETTWQWAHRGGSTQVLTDSGLTVTSKRILRLELELDPGSGGVGQATARLYDEGTGNDNDLVDARVLTGTPATYPGDSENLTLSCGIETLAASAEFPGVYSGRFQNRPNA